MKLPAKNLNPTYMTGASQAGIIAAVNAGLALVVLFGLPISDPQIAGIGLFLNALMGAFVSATKEQSPSRTRTTTSRTSH